MGQIVKLVRCFCGELMLKKKDSDFCWKCQCDSTEELNYKLKKRNKHDSKI